MQNIISITEGRGKIFDIAEDVQKPGVYYTFTEKGRPKAVMMSAGEFESWQETIEVAREFPGLNESAKEIDRAVKTGEYKKWATLDEVMAKFGYVVADKSKQKYAVGNKSGKKSTKRFK